MTPIITKVLIADDHTLVRDGIKALLSSEKDIEVIGEADNGETAIALAKQLKPDIVLMDIAMPNINGLEATKEILRFVDTKIILVSMHSDEEYVLESIRAGVSGFLHKQSAASALIEAVREVMKGGAFFSPSISKTVLEAAKQKKTEGADATKINRLTSREKQILQLIADGVPAKDIGQRLFISMPTVYKHRQNIMRKTGIHDLVGLTRFALKNNLIIE